jgi:hypothetical protein
VKKLIVACCAVLIATAALAATQSQRKASPAQSVTIPGAQQALQSGLGAVSPQGWNVVTGSASVPMGGMYQTSPDVYLSRYDATTAASCVTGMLDPCISPILRIDGTNASATHASTLNGLLVNLWGAKANTAAPVSGQGNTMIGIGAEVYDAVTPNITHLFGFNPNVGASGIPAQCHDGGAPGTTTTA